MKRYFRKKVIMSALSRALSKRNTIETYRYDLRGLHRLYAQGDNLKFSVRLRFEYHAGQICEACLLPRVHLMDMITSTAAKEMSFALWVLLTLQRTTI